jgi:hypothetical protein
MATINWFQAYPHDEARELATARIELPKQSPPCLAARNSGFLELAGRISALRMTGINDASALFAMNIQVRD